MSYDFYEKNSKEKLAETLKNEIKGCYEFIKKLEDDKAFLEIFESKIIGKYKELSGTKDYDSLIKDVVSWKDWKRLEKCHCSPQHDLNDWKGRWDKSFLPLCLRRDFGDSEKLQVEQKKLILSLSEDIENLKGLIEELERLDQKS